MLISENIIVGESIQDKLPDIMEKIRTKKKSRSFYCVTEASNPSNLLDIYCYSSLFSRYYRNFNPKIVALAGNKEEAISIVVNIVEKVNNKVRQQGAKEFSEEFREYMKQF